MTAMVRKFAIGLTLVSLATVAIAVMHLHNRMHSRTPAAKDSKNVNTALHPSVPEVAIQTPLVAAQQENIVLKFYNQGYYARALKTAEKMLSDQKTPDWMRTWLQSQLPTLLNTVAWRLLQKEACTKAVPMFERSIKLSPSKEANKGLGLCLYKLKQYGPAQDHFQLYLAEVPNDAEIKLLLADVLESQGSFAEALRQLDDAKDAPQELKETLEMERKKMASKLVEAEQQVVTYSDHFSLTYRANEHESLERFALHETLEPSLADFVEQLGFRVPKAPIEVVFYSDNNFTSIISNGPDWAQGLYDGRMRVPIRTEFTTGKNLELLARVLRHELVHALLADMTAASHIPSWFNEGLAQRLECGIKRCSEKSKPLQRGHWLSSEALTKPYINLGEIKARHSYYQSLFLINLLETARFSEAEIPIDDRLYKLISQLPGRGELSSDRLLQPLAPLDFPILYARAKRQWDRQIN